MSLTTTRLTIDQHARRVLGALTGTPPRYTQSKRYEHAAILSRETDRQRRAERAKHRAARTAQRIAAAQSVGKALFAVAFAAFAAYHWLVVDDHHDEIAARDELVAHWHTQATRAPQHTLTLAGDPQTIARAASAAGKALERKP